ncbi:MAG: cytochrome c/FTR1 family iron permease [Pseudomonadota bacterium]
MLRIFLTLWMGLFCGAGHAQTASVDSLDQGPTIVHLLDYVGVDYPGTVKDGKILDASEYAEQVEFVSQAMALLGRLPEKPSKAALQTRGKRLHDLIQAKAAGSEVATLADGLRWDVIRAYGIAIAPKQAPDLSRAAPLFATQCASCHGASGLGDGPLAKGMDPAPANFHDAERMRVRSVFGLYNTLTLGVTGTAMPAFKDLADDERWALALYASTLRASPQELALGESAWRSAGNAGAFKSLKDLVTRTASEVFAQHGANGEAMQAYLLRNPGALKTGASAPLELTRSLLDQSQQHYRQGHREQALQGAISAYLEGFELIENSLDNVDSGLRMDIEQEMMALRSAIGDKQSSDDVAARVAHMGALLDRAEQRLTAEGLSPTAAFASSLLILLREGLEAILVLAAIIAFVRKSGRRDALVYVHIGWVSAVVMGGLTWWAANSLITISGANREVTEGVTALIAAAMLLYVGYWLHSKSYAQAWQTFIHDKVSTALEQRTLWAMAAVSFLAVYRELFETILFYETLWVQAGPSGQTAVLGGIAAAAAVLAIVGWAILKYSVRLPMGPFFSLTSGLLAFLAVVFAGHGIAALQEAGTLAANPVHFVSIPLLGVHPTVQGLAAQAAALVLVVSGVLLAQRAARRA